MTLRKTQAQGFSLLEMMISIALTLLIAGSAFQALSYYQKSYISTQLRADVHAQMRAALELLTQEIGQAGLFTFAPLTVGGTAITAGSSAPVPMSSTATVYAGEQLLFDTDPAKQELVKILTVTSTSVTGVFTKNHAASAPVTATGLLPLGILPTSTATQLQLVGDLAANGTLVYALYNCDAAGGNFTRAAAPVFDPAGSGLTAAMVPSQVQVLIPNVIPNPGGTACFQYVTTTISGFTFFKQVAVTLSVQLPEKDPQTGAPITLTKSFLNIAPRNVLASLDDAQNSILNVLQPNPSNVPMGCPTCSPAF
jgi:prepilin-type N-terminal cleavage/methylation domain-containing protein